jgi:hypothetical protein
VRILSALIGLALLALASAIYPPDHFDYSTKLTNENYKSFISDNIAAGKTVFIRTIASSG